MGQAATSLLVYVILQTVVVIIGLNVVKDKEINASGILKSWIMGRMLMYGVLQLLTVPMILARTRFNTLFWSYLIITVILFFLGIWSIKGRELQLKAKRGTFTWLGIILLVLALVLIVWQAGSYFFGIHLDEDDARWLAEANDALEYGDMMTRDYNTGEYVSRFLMPEDISSPWPMTYAIASRVLFTRPAVFAHTVYPPVAILMMFGIYWLIGCEIVERMETKVVFVLLVAVINLFFGGNVYTQSAFSLVRIWQGKASVAALIIPLLFYLFICLNKKNETGDWIKVIIVGAAACLMSGMGIIIAAFMIGVYGVYNIVIYQRWKRIPLWLSAMIPSIVSFLTHYIIK